MHPSRSASRLIVRASLGALLGLVALNAFAGGWYGLRGAGAFHSSGSPGARSIPTSCRACCSWSSSAARSRQLRSPVFTAVRYAGSSHSRRGCWCSRGSRRRSGIIGYVSWMQPTTAAAGLLVLALAGLLPGFARAWRAGLRRDVPGRGRRGTPPLGPGRGRRGTPPLAALLGPPGRRVFGG